MKLIEKLFPERIRRLERIHDTDSGRLDCLRLDKNERLLDFPKKDIEELRQLLSGLTFSAYPELERIYSLMANYLEVLPEQIHIASGSDLAIRSIYECMIEPDDEVVLHLPSYAMYRVYAEMYGAKVQALALKEENWVVDIPAMLEKVNERTKFVVVENPNGFVGTKPLKEEIYKLAVELRERQVMLVIDEAYIYIEEDKFQHAELIRNCPNVVVTQTFSKAHGLAGARFGYLVGDSTIIGQLSKSRPMHEITGPTAVSVEWLLNHRELLTSYQDEIRASKKILLNGMKNLNIPMRNTSANFVLLYLPDEGKTKDIESKLHLKRILIRRPFREYYLKGWTRVCVGTLSDSELFLQALADILGGHL